MWLARDVSPPLFLVAGSVSPTQQEPPSPTPIMSDQVTSMQAMYTDGHFFLVCISHVGQRHTNVQVCDLCMHNPISAPNFLDGGAYLDRLLVPGMFTECTIEGI